MVRELNGSTTRTQLDQSSWFCCAVSLVVSAIVTICVLVVRYRPDAMSFTILPIIVCAMLMGVVIKNAIQRSVRNRRFLCLGIVVATAVLSSLTVMVVADQAIISRGIDAVLLTYREMR